MPSSAYRREVIVCKPTLKLKPVVANIVIGSRPETTPLVIVSTFASVTVGAVAFAATSAFVQEPARKSLPHDTIA